MPIYRTMKRYGPFALYSSQQVRVLDVTFKTMHEFITRLPSCEASAFVNYCSTGVDCVLLQAPLVRLKELIEMACTFPLGVNPSIAFLL